MNSDSELYVFLGKANDTFFFQHAVINPKFTKNISYEIYNILMKDHRIEHSEQNVIIYEIDEKNNIFNIISIQHMLKDENKIIKYDIKNLSEYFIYLLKQSKNDIFVIEYKYATKSYHIFETELVEKCNNAMGIEIPDSMPPFTEIHDVFTKFVIDN